MMPSDFQLLDSIPHTPSRKIDRDTLSRMPDSKLASWEEVQKPESEMEIMTAAFFREVLDMEEEISIQSNFFALGGNSLQAMRIVNRLREEFGVGLPLASIFLNPTVEELSKEIERNLDNR
jgi:acyl carrier protein